MEGKLIIVTAPSGAGKTTIVKYLLEKIPSLAFSVSATTRQKRKKETDGKDYYFLNVDEFKNKINNNEFVEWEEVYPEKFYGTLKSELTKLWAADKHIIFDVDVKGALSLKNKYPANTFSIFIKPPSIDILIERLKLRATETEQTLAVRIERVKKELTYENKFDYIILNDVLENTFEKALISVSKFLND